MFARPSRRMRRIEQLSSPGLVAPRMMAPFRCRHRSSMSRLDALDAQSRPLEVIALPPSTRTIVLAIANDELITEQTKGQTSVRPIASQPPFTFFAMGSHASVRQLDETFC